MSNIVFWKRIFTSKTYWLSVMAAILLLMCSIVYRDSFTGEKYTFISLFYDDVARKALEYGEISLRGLILGYDTGYLWMFCPIIVGIPCVILNKTERLVLFRTGKNKYLLSKFFSNIIASGCILLIAYLVYVTIGMILAQENIWNMSLVRKMVSVFCWGIISAFPSIILSEFVRNKYLILCVPFVINYFMCIFIGNILPYDVKKYVDPFGYQILFLHNVEMIIPCVGILLFLMVGCVFLKKIALERRCDCGQQ